MSDLPVLQPSAEIDIEQIAAWIVERADVDTALSYVARIRARIATLVDFPNRGSNRPEFGDGIRSIAFEGRYLILYRVVGDRVLVTRIVAGAQDLSGIAL